jgi:hypothetical protein
MKWMDYKRGSAAAAKDAVYPQLELKSLSRSISASSLVTGRSGACPNTLYIERLIVTTGATALFALDSMPVYVN